MAITSPSVTRVVPGDVDDEKVIALAGEAQYLVSGGDHLLSMGRYQGVIILKPAAFILLWNTLHQDLPESR